MIASQSSYGDGWRSLWFGYSPGRGGPILYALPKRFHVETGLFLRLNCIGPAQQPAKFRPW